jgi:hypothetical protein
MSIPFQMTPSRRTLNPRLAATVAPIQYEVPRQTGHDLLSREPRFVSSPWSRRAEEVPLVAIATPRPRHGASGNACNGKLAMPTPRIIAPILSRSSSFTLQQVSGRVDRSPFSTQRRYLSHACYRRDCAGPQRALSSVVQAYDLATTHSLRWGANHFVTGEKS